MTDEDKLYAIDSLLGNEWNVSRNRISHVDAIARIREILDGPPPVVEWEDATKWSAYAEIAECRMTVWLSEDEPTEWCARAFMSGDRDAQYYRLPTREAAKAMALVLYRALRGVK